MQRAALFGFLIVLVAPLIGCGEMDGPTLVQSGSFADSHASEDSAAGADNLDGPGASLGPDDATSDLNRSDRSAGDSNPADSAENLAQQFAWVSASWNGAPGAAAVNFDLHVVNAQGTEIYYLNTGDGEHGRFADHDECPSFDCTGEETNPRETVVWKLENLAPGQYQAWVENASTNAGEFRIEISAPDYQVDETDMLAGGATSRVWQWHVGSATRNLTALFTNPVDAETPDLALEQALTDLIRATPRGAKIRASYFTWTRRSMAREMVDAHRRGVDVRIVLGNRNKKQDGSLNAAVQLLRDNLGDAVTICEERSRRGACIGTGINHNKFVLFSELDDGSRKVVWQSSANLTNPQLRSFNNAVVIRNDPDLYGAYFDYWQDLRRDRTNLDYYRSRKGSLATKAYFFPRSSGDTIVGILNNVRCGKGARVRISMAFFTDARIAVADRLRQMARNGCDVAINLRRGKLLGDDIVATLRHPKIDLLIYPEGHKPSIHSKYLLVDGAYGDEGRRQKIVWTGSHNYTGTALRRNDETLLKIRDDAVFDAFERDWKNIRNRAP